MYVPYIPHILARQQLSKNVTMATNTHTTIEGLLDALFSMWSVSYQRKVGDWWLFPELFIIFIGFMSGLK
jgi:hypothetical protein